jgi:hypothetical protein
MHDTGIQPTPGRPQKAKTAVKKNETKEHPARGQP